MNLVDTNGFVRYLTKPATVTEQRFHRLVHALFTSTEPDDNQFTTTPEVISEVIFVLSTDQFGLSRQEIATNLIAVLTLGACQMQHRDEIVESLLLWTTKPRLSYVDVRLLVRAQAEQMTLLTFDTDLAKAARIQRWDLQTSRERA